MAVLQIEWHVGSEQDPFRAKEVNRELKRFRNEAGRRGVAVEFPEMVDVRLDTFVGIFRFGVSANGRPSACSMKSMNFKGMKWVWASILAAVMVSPQLASPHEFGPGDAGILAPLGAL